MSTYFFSSYLPTGSELQEKYQQLVLKYVAINKYLYMTTVHKILTSLSASEQKEFILALESSEALAQRWLDAKPRSTQLVTEHLERSILALHSQLL